MRSAGILAAMVLGGCSPSNAGNDQANTTEAVTEVQVPQAQPTPQTQQAETAPPEVNDGRCGMEECSYSQEIKRQVIGGGANGRLVKLTLRGGTSSRSGSAITWETSPHDVYVYCSTVLPSVMLETEGSWQVDVLDFINGVPGVLESSQSIYSETCHKEDRQFPNDAKDLGYQQIPEDKQDISIKKPEDIFNISSE